MHSWLDPSLHSLCSCNVHQVSWRHFRSFGIWGHHYHQYNDLYWRAYMIHSLMLCHVNGAAMTQWSSNERKVNSDAVTPYHVQAWSSKMLVLGWYHMNSILQDVCLRSYHSCADTCTSLWRSILILFAVNSAHISASHTFHLLSPPVELLVGLPASDRGCFHSFRGQDTAVLELLSQALPMKNLVYRSVSSFAHLWLPDLTCHVAVVGVAEVCLVVGVLPWPSNQSQCPALSNMMCGLPSLLWFTCYYYEW